MDILERAILDAKLAKHAPIGRPKPPARKPVVDAAPPKPKPPAIPIVVMPPAPADLPGLAPWRDKRVITSRPRVLEIKTIISVVAAEFELTREQIRGNYRTRKFTFPRHVAQYLACRLVNNASLPIIGRAFYRDHTSVLSARRKIERMLDEDPATRELVEKLERRLRNIARELAE